MMAYVNADKWTKNVVLPAGGRFYMVEQSKSGEWFISRAESANLDGYLQIEIGDATFHEIKTGIDMLHGDKVPSLMAQFPRDDVVEQVLYSARRIFEG